MPGALAPRSDERMPRQRMCFTTLRKPRTRVVGYTSPKGAAMAENKTKATEASVKSYLPAIEDEARRKDCAALVQLMTKATR